MESIIITITMDSLEKISERRRSANLAEGVELNAEVKEKQTEQAEKKLAAKERLELTSREIKTTKNQIQNIVANMQQVIKAVQAIRAQLQIVQNDDDIPSVKRDEKALAGLKKRLDGLYGEIKDLRLALAMEEKRSIQEEQPEMAAEMVDKEAERRVEAALAKLGITEK